MFNDSQNQRDTSPNPIKDSSDSSDYGSDSSPLALFSQRAKYRKTNKLITALYMVTDIIEKEEPMRSKLRTLGVDILAEVGVSKEAQEGIIKSKIETIMSFLSIAADMNIISEMNANILLQEFTELRKSVINITTEKNSWLGEFLKKPLLEEMPAQTYLSNMSVSANKGFYKGHSMYKGQREPQHESSAKGQDNSIGVQKGSTLLSALQQLDKKDKQEAHSKRHKIISDIIKDNQKDSEGLTITDIKDKAKGELVQLGKKTLQRELVAMVDAGILRKHGQKRWSKYSLI